MVCVCVLSFPFPSLKVQVIWVDSVIGKVVLWVTVTVPLQLSVAVGMLISSSNTSHSIVISGSVAMSGTGTMVSPLHKQAAITAVSLSQPIALSLIVLALSGSDKYSQKVSMLQIAKLGLFKIFKYKIVSESKLSKAEMSVN